MTIMNQCTTHNNLNYRVKDLFQSLILRWYSRYGRVFPWRESQDPFDILVAELLLQRTDAAKVVSVYKKLIRRWSSPIMLSRAGINSIGKVIQPLGLKYKAVRLKTTSEIIVSKLKGIIPEDYDNLITLPGVGSYIASAVECFAFNRPKAVLDTNVDRILNRVFNIRSEKKRLRNDIKLWDIAQRLVPSNNPKNYNWGLIDFGAIIYRNREPLCSHCLIIDICFHFSNDEILW